MEALPPTVSCFVGIRPTGAVVQALRDLRDALQREAPEVVKWHPPEKWHVTLCFLGLQEVSLLPVFEAALAGACRAAKPFAVHPGSLILWPSAGRARIVGLKVGGDRVALDALQSDVAGRLRAYLPDPGQEFTPHLTLGYVRHGAVIGSVVRLCLQQLGTRSFPHWTVDTVELMHGGGQYRTLASFAVGGGQSDRR